MSKLSLCLLFLIPTLTTFGQSFEGKIVYKVNIKSKTPAMTDEQWTKTMGSTHVYYVKGGSYKSEMDGTILQWQLYVPADNKLYSKMSNSDAALWNDGSVSTDPVLKSEINKGVATVMGYICDELILTCKSGVQKYYFSQKIGVVAPALYVKHKYGNWYDYLSKTHALPLQSIISNAQFEFEETAVEVRPMPLDNKLFHLPEGIKTAASPY